MSVDRDSGDAFDRAALAEDVDLDVGRREEILRAEAMVASCTHWQALGLSWNASAASAKAAYLERAKAFHPDRYAGLRLGTYRGRLERVFRRLTEARDVLADEVRRQAYARETAPPEEFARAEARRLDDERRAQERRARLARGNPLLARAGRVAELTRRGREALDAGRVAEAANDLQLAHGMDPDNGQLKALAEEARRRAAALRAAEHFERGLAAQALGNAAGALASFRAALEADPRHARAAAQGARSALAAGDPAAALPLAEAGVRAAPQAGFAHEALGLVLEAQGARKEARRALERALELDPKLPVARERLKRLRWGFLG